MQTGQEVMTRGIRDLGAKKAAPEPRALVRASLEAAGWEFDAAHSSLMRKLRRSPELAKGLMYWALEIAIAEAMRQMLRNNDPASNVAGDRTVAVGGQPAVVTHHRVAPS